MKAKCKKEYQLNATENFKNLCNARQKFIELYNDYSKVRCEAVYKTKQGTGLEILTPK